MTDSSHPRDVACDPALYDGIALAADPIHGYLTFTVPTARPSGSRETTEKDLIDHPWLQRLRAIYQLQSARWVFPSAEHSRFQHVLGAMHVAGRFGRHLHPFLAEVVPDCPSAAYLEELLKVTALLHDVGHGPFCHFFDDNILEEYGLTHEIVGQVIIREALGDLIPRIRRSASGPFGSGEALDPEHLGYLIRKDDRLPRRRRPRWLTLLQPIFSGVYTADNLDYVLRDSYMCGVAVGPVDLERLLHYTFLTPKGLTLHRAGCTALAMFLNARSYLYTNVYYHRTTRAIDLHLREIFRPTIKHLFPGQPLKHLEAYLELTDWSLLEEVRRWKHTRDAGRRRLAAEWDRILRRDLKWKMAYETTFPLRRAERGRTFLHQAEITAAIRRALPPALKRIEFRVDMANQDPRPLNPLMMGNRQLYIFTPATRLVSKEPLEEFLGALPARLVQCRVYVQDHRHDRLLAEAADRVLAGGEASHATHL